MITRKEKILMKYLLEVCGEKDTCLLSPLDLCHVFDPKYTVNEVELASILEGLSQENYISVINSDKGGNLIYCITLLSKGKAFVREQKNIKINWSVAITRTIILAIISFIVGIILKAIF